MVNKSVVEPAASSASMAFSHCWSLNSHSIKTFNDSNINSVRVELLEQKSLRPSPHHSVMFARTDSALFTMYTCRVRKTLCSLCCQAFERILCLWSNGSESHIGVESPKTELCRNVSPSQFVTEQRVFDAPEGFTLLA